jgi:CheY-like chemotaxis protein
VIFYEQTYESSGLNLKRSRTFPAEKDGVNMSMGLLKWVNPSVVAKRILVVEDDDDAREVLATVLEYCGFVVVQASDVNSALKLIATRSFDVLLSDLHMPHACDGLTVASAMRNSNPNAVTFIFSGHPAMDVATEAILQQTDEILTKPMSPEALVAAIDQRLKLGARSVQKKEPVADILEQETSSTIFGWLKSVKGEPGIISVPLTDAERMAHLPALFHDLVKRLRNPLPLGTRALASPESAKHGRLRRVQGYTATMMVEESRMLQVAIFHTLQLNLHRVNFSIVLANVMAIADEVDSQLAQAMASYITLSKVDSKPLNA